MPKARISRTSVDKLEYPGKQIRYFDSKITGFGVVVSQDNRTYFVQCRVRGRKNKSGAALELFESIGRIGVVQFDDAVKRAKQILEDAANGITPDDRRQEREALESEKKTAVEMEQKKDITLQAMFESYIKTKKKLKDSSKWFYQKDIDLYVPDWKDRPLRSINGDDIITRHEEIGTNRSRARADGCMRVIRAIFNHAMAMYPEIIIRNPVSKLSAADAWYNVARKETYLQPSDLKEWLPALLELDCNPTYKDLILLLLFQGSRLEETCSLQYKDLNLTIGTCKFRETKTGIVLEVPLPRFIIERLKARMEWCYEGPESWVFPGDSESGHVEGARHILKKIMEQTGIRVSHHDLRRSFISYCEEIEITIFTRKRLANHAIPLDVTEGYTMFNMEKLRAVIERIADFILANAGITQKPQPILTEEQMAKLASTPFWESLTPQQRDLFLAAVALEQPSSVIPKV